MPPNTNRNPQTRPYAEIVVRIHPEFARRISTNLTGIRGITSNLSPSGYLAFLFEINEYLPKNRKLTDYQIAKCVAAEFPQRQVYQKLLDTQAGRIPVRSRYSIKAYRSYYNKGTLLPKKGRHGPISFGYNEAGERLSNKNSKKLLEQEEYEAILKRYGPEHRGTEPFDWSYRLVPPPPNRGGRPSYKSFDWCI